MHASQLIDLGDDRKCVLRIEKKMMMKSTITEGGKK
jgi:hypothetical protein